MKESEVEALKTEVCCRQKKEFFVGKKICDYGFSTTEI